MNILVLGNGFDLAHNLPTKYTDFLNFINVISQVLTTHETDKQDLNSLDWHSLHPELKKYILNTYNSSDNNWLTSPIIKDWNKKVTNNFWFQYFEECDMHGNENWIDFETEISHVIQKIDIRMYRHKANLYDKEQSFSNHFANEKDSEYKLIIERIARIKSANSKLRYKDIRDTLLTGLEDLILVLEWYLTYFIANISVKTRSKDIENLHPDKVLSFNYTNTYQTLYDKKKNCTYDFIHGKASTDVQASTNNMVLGIDEYLPKNRKNKDITFIAFKKFYQRIYKETGCEYQVWIEEIQSKNRSYTKEIKECKNRLRENKGIGMEGYETRARLKDLKTYPPKYKLYIFGHSLDITDKDILKELILCENVYTTIFYRNREHMGALITNLVKVIGQDRLIQKTGGSMPTIIFKKQQEMYDTF